MSAKILSIYKFYEKCKVPDESESCTKAHKIVDIYDKDTIYYFVDTPGLDDSEGDKKI